LAQLLQLYKQPLSFTTPFGNGGAHYDARRAFLMAEIASLEYFAYRTYAIPEIGPAEKKFQNKIKRSKILKSAKNAKMVKNTAFSYKIALKFQKGQNGPLSSAFSCVNTFF